MDPVLAEIYRTVFDAAPYVIAAYGLLWVGLGGYVFFVLHRLSGVEREIAVLEESVARRS
ncbi:MAG: CcmD family protein [Actinobacteria bacterium]|nr:CcmD family protein [Actinomycetota bacterium]MCG2807820.1 CcmD family protein [Coriobacteriia bacterium]MDP2234717.1 CcmD family protein [Actinomycetota bacterium]